MQGDSKAITSSKEQKKFECHETTGSRSRLVTPAITFITNKTKKPLGDKCEKKPKYFHNKSDCFRHNSIPYNKPRRTLQTEKSKEQNDKASVRLLQCLRNLWKFKGRVKFQNVESTKILFLFMFYYHFQFVLIQIVQTGAILFKTALKVELFSCFDGRPITRARKKILAVKMNKQFGTVIWLGNLEWRRCWPAGNSKIR